MKKMSRQDIVVRVQSAQGTKRILTKKTERFKKFLEKVIYVCAQVPYSNFVFGNGRLRRLSN